MSPTKSTKSTKRPVQEDFVFDVPEGYNDDVGSTLNDGIQLPFFAPFLSFNNGSSAFKKISLAAYTGGWSMFTEDMDTLNAEIGHPHDGFELVEGLSKKGGEYDAWLAQHLYVTMIGQRTRWLTSDTGKKRSHMQALCAIAEDPGGTEPPVFYSMVVLVAKGYQTDYLKRAFGSWYSASLPLRKSFAGSGRPALHESLFWVPIGRFGKDRKVEMKGEGRNQSEVAPIVSQFPDLSKGGNEYLRMMYIGRETAEFLQATVKDSQEWLNDKIWRDGADQPSAAAQSDLPEVPPPDDDVPEWMREEE